MAIALLDHSTACISAHGSGCSFGDKAGCYQQVNAETFISTSLTAELVISEQADTASSHPEREVIVVLSLRLYTQLWPQLTSSL